MSWTLPLVIAAGIAGRMIWRAVERRNAQISPVAEGQPEVMDAVKAFRAKNWNKLVAIYRDRTPSDRYHFLRGLGALTRPGSELPPSPAGDLAILCAGVCLGWAWRHRGGGIAESVGDGAIKKMLDALLQTVGLLDRDEGNLDSVGRAIRVRAEMGMQGNRGELQRQLNAAHELEERNIFVAYNHIVFVAPKWHGSLDEMFEVAREYAAQPVRPAWIALPAVAHAEAWLYLTAMSESLDDKERGRHFYVDSEEFLHELEAMDDAFWRAREAHLGALPHAELMLAHNYLAYLLYRKGLTGRLTRHLALIDRDLWAIPWGFVGIDAYDDYALGLIRRGAAPGLVFS
jgi:hypothetical protein